MKIWVDDIRKPPSGYLWLKSVREVKLYFCSTLNIDNSTEAIECVNLDHDAGDYNKWGGDYIEILKWLEQKEFIDGWKINTKFRIHSMNVVGREQMNDIIRSNGWGKY